MQMFKYIFTFWNIVIFSLEFNIMSPLITLHFLGTLLCTACLLGDFIGTTNPTFTAVILDFQVFI